MKCRLLVCVTVMALFLSGCVTQGAYDYTAFKESRPKSILVLPPVNNSPEVGAGYGFLAQTTFPLAERGYYVFPVALVDETLKQNGVTVANDAHAISLKKLQEVFGADSILYITIENYGTTYKVIASDTRVTANAKLIDGRTGTLLWEGRATASSTENSNNNNGLLGILIGSLVEQVIASATDRSYDVAGIASQRLLGAGGQNGLLHGPRSPNYEPN